MFNNIRYGIENLIKWFKVIWNDRDWDHNFIYIILRHKINNTKRFTEKYSHHAYPENDIKNMKICVSLLDRLIKGEYLDNALRPHYKKWGGMNLIFKKVNNKDYETLSIEYKKCKTQRENDQADKEFRKCGEHSDYMERQDLDYLFKLLRKHIRSWWD